MIPGLREAASGLLYPTFLSRTDVNLRKISPSTSSAACPRDDGIGREPNSEVVILPTFKVRDGPKRKGLASIKRYINDKCFDND